MANVPNSNKHRLLDSFDKKLGIKEIEHLDKITDKELNDSLDVFDDIIPRYLTDKQLQAYESTAYNAYLDAQKEIYLREVLNETRLKEEKQ